jgi:hypothetical protein
MDVREQPVILTTQDEVDQWLTAPIEEALKYSVRYWTAP